MVTFPLAIWIAIATFVQADYWLGSIPHQGASAFNPDKTYKVFRNVRDFGAKGDGVTDDTNAINAAISAGSRCGAGCDSSTTTPALVYFPSGTYVVSAPLVQYYYTFMTGDANQLPVLKAAPSFSGIAVIDADAYLPGGVSWFTNQNNFFREIKNFRIDLTAAPSATGVHWQVSQATSLQNIFFDMAPGGAQQGIFMENGSGGFLSNLTFTGGKIGMVVGNQQFTTRDLVFNGCTTAVLMLWDWGWVFKGLRISGASVGIDMSTVATSGNPGTQQVGSVILLDSTFSNVGIAVKTYFGAQSGPGPAGSLRVDNVNFVNTPVGVGSPTGATILAGNQLVAAWAQGSIYTGGSLQRSQGLMTPLVKPAGLMSGSSILERNQPLYQAIPASNVLSAKSNGAKGDGVTDDTAALQALFNLANPSNLIFLDHGAYVVTNTITIPPGARITGEVFSIILASGTKFKNVQAPVPVFRVGQAGDVGSVELSNIIFEVAGPLPGAILVEWNIKPSSPGAAALWNVHARVGGTAGSQLQQDKCSQGTTDTTTCSGPFMLFHSTPQSGLYMENCWWWTADHDLDTSGHNKLSLFTGRGMLVESQEAVWLYGTASEHNQFYNYQFSGVKAVFASMFQVETPYFQGVPNALVPFPVNSQYNDPTFSNCSPSDSACVRTWGLRFVNSNNVLVYGAGLYSFFDNYSQDCYASQSCQTNIVSIESSSVALMGLNTIGVKNMVTVDGIAQVAASALSSILGNNGIKLLSTLEFMQAGAFVPPPPISSSSVRSLTTTSAAPPPTSAPPTSTASSPTTVVVRSSTTDVGPSPTTTGAVGPIQNWTPGAGPCLYAPNCDWAGQDLTNKPQSGDGSQCSTACAQTAGCTHFTWTNYNGGTCWMKTGAADPSKAIVLNNSPNALCGYIVSSTTSSIIHPTTSNVAPTSAKPTSSTSKPVSTSVPCILTSVVGDAVYCVAGSACGGAGASPVSTLCPSANTVAAQGCVPGIPSYQNGKCVLPHDSQCTKLASGAWGCTL
ncbi:pectate lyase superfamily protein-domain-containing protein [Chytriomyces sp. MP71]|nr:pectate lyase superfamily protein-domain-containing protein [Chytriomyces sp. MP71]